MSVKVKQAITKCLVEIQDCSFDEHTIRTLLIVLREYLSKNSLIKELAHFIAHPERNQGIFHKKVNSRYTKLKLSKEQIQKLIANREIAQEISTENEYSDFVLSAVGVNKIESKLFKILYIDGLDDLPEEHLKKHINFNKAEVKKLLETSYTQREGYHYLNLLSTERIIALTEALPVDKYNPSVDIEQYESIQNARLLISKIRLQIDGIQKVIRGAIFFDSVFDSDYLNNEIQLELLNVIKKFNIDDNFIEGIRLNQSDILLCFMTLLHDSIFEFYDQNKARTFLCFYCHNNTENSKNDDYEMNEDIYQNGVLALYINYEFKGKSTECPLFVSDLPVKKYLSYDNFIKNPLNSLITEVPWINAKRDGKLLKLTAD